jgi:hypothetical protein
LSRPFRRLDISTGAVVWEPVNELVQGHVYVEGSMAVCFNYLFEFFVILYVVVTKMNFISGKT